MSTALGILVGLYLVAPVCSLIYLVVLLRKDIKFACFDRWYIARFRLISTESRYARAWKGWYGCGLWGYMITNDASPEGVRHEARHSWWWLIAGGYYGLAYGADWLRLKLFTDKDAYLDNWAERDARAYASRPLQKR